MRFFFCSLESVVLIVVDLEEFPHREHQGSVPRLTSSLFQAAVKEDKLSF